MVTTIIYRAGVIPERWLSSTRSLKRLIITMRAASYKSHVVSDYRQGFLYVSLDKCASKIPSWAHKKNGLKLTQLYNLCCMLY